MRLRVSHQSDYQQEAALPQAGRQRWLAGRKAQVLAAIQSGTLSLEEACRRYLLTPEELQSWHASFASDGVAGLKMKRLAERRTNARRKVSEPGAALLDSGDRLPCLITDLGSQGARLVFRVRLPVPRQFKLLCIRSGRTLPASVRWQREQSVGLQFEDAEANELKGIDDLGSWLLGDG